MLSYFKIKNFKSVLEEELSFKFKEGKLPNGYKKSEVLYGLIKSKTPRRIFVPVSSYFGENASGKSTIIEAFFTLQKIILDNQLIYQPNILNKKYDNTEFEIEIVVNKNIYKYKLTYNYNSILEECLYKNDNIVYEIKNNIANFKNIISEQNIFFKEKMIDEFFKTSCIDTTENNIQNKLFLSCVKNIYQSLNKDISTFYKAMTENIEVYPCNNFSVGIVLNKLSKNQNNEELQNSFNEIIKILQKLDLSIHSATFKRENKEISENINMNKYASIVLDTNLKTMDLDLIETKHIDINGNLVPFNFSEQESLGTKKLFGIIGVFLNVLKKGKTLIIDELEQSIHPILLRTLILMFKDKEYNKYNAQLIFTTHNTDILDNNILRISEINIVKNTLKKGTKATNLTELEDEKDKLRNVTNFRKQYLNGLYSGIPFPII